MEADKLFQHEPFPPELHDSLPFRILRLSPGYGHDDLIGELLRSNLDSSVGRTQYEALSYCCGDATEVARIYLHSGYLPLGHNLSKALFALRLTNMARELWIDAICINQNDLDERAREVRLMHHVYQQATQVSIWLDKPSDKVEYWSPQLAFNIATQLSALSDLHPDLNIHELGRIRKKLTRRRVGIARRRMHRGEDQRCPDALRLIFTCHWFERMWVVQEAICATSAVVICEKNSLDFTTLMRALEYGLRSGLWTSYRHRKIFFPLNISAPSSNLSAASAMYLLNGRVSPDSDMLNLLCRFHGSKSSDPRDKLFALYGI